MLEWIKAVTLVVVVFLTPVHSLMACVGLLIAADFVTGIIRASKGKEKITSTKAKRTVLKALVYQLAVISGFALETIMPGLLPISKLVAGAIGMVEFKSIAENVQATTGVSLFDLIKNISNSSKPQ